MTINGLPSVPPGLITDEGWARALEIVERAARSHLANIDERPVQIPGTDEKLEVFDSALPEAGAGAEAAIQTLVDKGLPLATNSIGPRFYHLVVGGATPAALAADWFASLVDQISYAWMSSPLSARLEQISIRWLLDLFGLPHTWGGVLTTGATTGNLVCLAGARQWWGEQSGIDIGKEGLIRQPPVLAGSYIHPSSRKALAILGVGASHITRFAAGDEGATDLDAMERALVALDGAPSIMIATAGDPNAGGYDPIADMAELADAHNAWLHVDGAFGLFAACSPRLAHLLDGAKRARSASVDLHKWMNVPYDSGAAFVHDLRYLARAFYHEADYLPHPDDPHPNFGFVAPEMSRRARAFPVWATLYAYGREGIRSLIERSVALAEYLAAQVGDADDMELMAEQQLNVVCFRYHPPGVDDEERLDRLNARIQERVVAEGKVSFGTTLRAGRVAFRPTMANWRIRPEDMEFLLATIRNAGQAIATEQ